jgi:predicted benzoate:H+ symporter BenE
MAGTPAQNVRKTLQLVGALVLKTLLIRTIDVKLALACDGIILILGISIFSVQAVTVDIRIAMIITFLLFRAVQRFP